MPYYSLNTYLRKEFGEKIYKLSLNGGMTCPNRDGTLGESGCIFCSAGGSGEFAASKDYSITRQIQEQKVFLRNKISGGKFIGYFQAFTNTYAPVAYLRKIFMEAIMHPEIVALSIGTRPDCLGEDVLQLLEELNTIKPVWVELGLQTIHETTAAFIQRGYELPVFDKAVQDLKRIHIPVIVHTIIGLPYETSDKIIETIDYISRIGVFGVKLQLLHILKGTALADIYNKKPFHIYTLDEYVDILILCIEHLSPEIVIHRFTGDGPKQLLIEPKWSAHKKRVLNSINSELSKRQTWQGRRYL